MINIDKMREAYATLREAAAGRVVTCHIHSVTGLSDLCPAAFRSTATQQYEWDIAQIAEHEDGSTLTLTSPLVPRLIGER